MHLASKSTPNKLVQYELLNIVIDIEIDERFINV